MTFKEAKEYAFPFGKYKGKTLDEIARTDEGLCYLDWAISLDLKPQTADALETYLSDPGIAKDLRDLRE